MLLYEVLCVGCIFLRGLYFGIVYRVGKGMYLFFIGG